MSTNPKDPNWKKDPARLFLLANFIGPQSLDELAIPPELAQALGEDPQRVLQQLLQAGALQYVDPDEPPERIYSRIRIRELQALLEARDLEVSGTKQELLNRLANANHEALYRALLRKTQLQCTEEARPIAIDHLTTEGRSLLSKLNLPDEWWLKFLVRVAEWIAAGVLGNWVYDALTKADEQPPPEVPEQTPTPLAPTPQPTPARQSNVDWSSAIADFERVIALNSKDAWAYIHRSLARSRKGDLVGAIADLERAIDLNPGGPRLLTKLSELVQLYKKKLRLLAKLNK